MADIVERGPIPAIHEVVRWRLADLAQWIWEEFGVSLSETTVGRECGRWGIASSRHALATSRRTNSRSMLLKKPSGRTGRDPRKAPGRNRNRAVVTGRGPRSGRRIHHPRWARRGTRPAPHDQRAQWATSSARSVPRRARVPRRHATVHSPAMAAHLAEISASVDPAPTPCSCSIRPDGTCPPNSSFRPTSPCFRCRPDRRN